MPVESCPPNPENLITSIAEQGYTLESSIADLIDNSISAEADKIEVLIDPDRMPFRLFIADNGNGMAPIELKQNMNFPSSSMEENRSPKDLGRFGLGMKTASFSQTRCFTVITKKKNEKKYNARTWDVDHLKKTGQWEIMVNTEEEIEELLEAYRILTKGFLNPFPGFEPNTIIIWKNLYKFDTGDDLQDKSSILRKELTETTKEHLQLIFHRFMEAKAPLMIRLNNEQLEPYNPFPPGIRNISARQKLLMSDKLTLEGFVLPNRSIEESKGASQWTMPHKSLMDMEGLYVYRANRIIVFGGWNNIVRKSSRLQLARLKIEIGNGIDNLFQLNVAKSSINIPYGERISFVRYISELKTEAEKEFYSFEKQSRPSKAENKSILKKIPTNHGINLSIDPEFSLLKALTDTLNEEQNKQLKIIFKMISTAINKIKKVHTDDTYPELLEKEKLNESDIVSAIKLLIESKVNKNNILNDIIPAMGIDNKSLPKSILSLLE